MPEFYDGIIIPKINNQADLAKWGLPQRVLDRRLRMKQRFDEGIFGEGFMGKNPLSIKTPGEPTHRATRGLMDPEAWMNLSKKEHIPKPSVGMRRDELQEALGGRRELVDEIPAVRIGKKIRQKIRDRNK